MTKPTTEQILEALERRAPRSLADDGDQIGLLHGSPGKAVNRAVVCEALTRDSVEVARCERADLMICYRPPTEELSSLLSSGGIEGAGLLCCHTNVRYARGGLADFFANAMGLAHVRPVLPVLDSGLLKVAIFVPSSHVDGVREAMAKAGAGRIGDYEECSFMTPGTGTYRPLPGASPYSGEVGRLEKADELRLEMLVARDVLSRVLAIMQAAHPYEEVACDIHPLLNPIPGAGRARIGELKRKMSGKQLALDFSAAVGGEARLLGRDRQVTGLAVVFAGPVVEIDAVLALGPDLCVAERFSSEEEGKAAAAGAALIEMGPDITERAAVSVLTEWLESDFANLNLIRAETRSPARSKSPKKAAGVGRRTIGNARPGRKP
jgi:hypothetical protein